MTKTFHEASKPFFAAIIVVAIGAAGVMYFKPAVAKKPKPVQLEDGRRIVRISIEGGEEKIRMETKSKVTTTDDEGEETTTEEWVPGKEYSLFSDQGKNYLREYKKYSAPNLLLVALSIILTAACWGSYGPVLHKGQMKMKGSKMRPFICVGLAYFAIAVVIPFILLPSFPEKGAFDFAHTSGILWSLLAGTVGAVGALGIIYAFNFGGKPIFVMPLVFGMAPVINTFTTIVTESLYGKVPSAFFFCLLMVILGAVCVLLFAPKPKPKPAADPKKPEVEKSEEKSEGKESEDKASDK